MPMSVSDLPAQGSAVRSEFLPATLAPAQDIVLLHGWGSTREIWRPLLVHLRQWANVTLIDLPGCSLAGPELEWDKLLQEVLLHCPEQSVFMGWSLGGQLAVALAHEQPSRALAVCTVCSNPRFVAQRDWPGMPAEDFSAFTASTQEDPLASLRRFFALQCRGSSRQRATLRELNALLQAELAAQVPTGPLGQCGRSLSANLLKGLDWLGALDMRDALTELRVPQLHLFTEADSLVPEGVAPSLKRLLSSQPVRASVKTKAGFGHVLPLEAPDLLAQELHGFLARCRLLRSAPEHVAQFEKRDVAASFSKAAGSYDAAASLQQEVGAQLLARLDAIAPGAHTVVDLGCGTGYFTEALHARYPGARHIGLDLAPGMVTYARERAARYQEWVVADAEALPLASDSVDLIFSSLALQWCTRPAVLFAELARVLRPGGRCLFATLGPDTLKELRASWASVDDRQHVNQFLCTADLVRAVPVRAQITLETEGFVMHYERVKELLLELKALGAHNVNRNRSSGLTSRTALRGMQQAYEQWRSDGRLPATYEVIFGELEAA